MRRKEMHVPIFGDGCHSDAAIRAADMDLAFGEALSRWGSTAFVEKRGDVYSVGYGIGGGEAMRWSGSSFEEAFARAGSYGLSR